MFGEDQPDICFIIRDHKDKKTELIVDESVMKFEAMLKEAGVTDVKTIMPLSKLKQDYGPHNMKLKLLNTYDLFLVESEIAEHAYTILGKVILCQSSFCSMLNIVHLFSAFHSKAQASSPDRHEQEGNSQVFH